MTDDKLKGLFETLRRENATMREESVAAHAQTRRHFDVAVEQMEKRFDLLAESVANVDEKLDRKTAAIEERMERGFAEGSDPNFPVTISFSVSRQERRRIWR